VLVYENDHYWLDGLLSSGISEQEFSLFLHYQYFLPAYQNDTDGDYLSDHGAGYLLWSGIIAGNTLTHTFVPRQEGALDPPAKLRDDSLEALIVFDSHRNKTSSDFV
jgi:hypothetical protein